MCHGKRGQIVVVVKGTLCVSLEKGADLSHSERDIMCAMGKGPDLSHSERDIMCVMGKGARLKS